MRWHALVMCLALLTGDVAQADSAKAPTKTGTLTGTFIYDGPPPVREVQLPGGPIPPFPLIVNPENRGLANVVIYLRPPQRKELKQIATIPAVPRNPVKLQIKGGRIWPHVALVRLGQPLEIENVDANFHALNFQTIFNAGGARFVKPNDKVTLTFSHSELLPVHVKDQITISLTGVVVINEQPFMAVSGADGQFHIDGLPRGRELEFELWHERVGRLNGDRLSAPALKPRGINKKGRFTVRIKPGENPLGTIHVSPAALEPRP